jgi:2',3'-cyclic-nucleotide 2'-phosphodiesterase (5'-nucleotidase family)
MDVVQWITDPKTKVEEQIKSNTNYESAVAAALIQNDRQSAIAVINKWRSDANAYVDRVGITIAKQEGTKIVQDLYQKAMTQIDAKFPAPKGGLPAIYIVLAAGAAIAAYVYLTRKKR